MEALVAVETVLLVLLVVLVAGLLRSHAEILRRLGPAGAAGAAETIPPSAAPTRRRNRDSPAPVLAGSTPGGDAVKLAFDGGAVGPTLLAFLTSGCSSCAGFWESLGSDQLPDRVQPVIVARGRERESPSRLRSLAPSDVPVVMSSRAWKEYGVPGAPYFVLVDGGVRGEGVATSWAALASLVADAIADEHAATESPRVAGAARRRLDQTFAAAGIGPDDPSLYPGRTHDRGMPQRAEPAEAAERAEAAQRPEPAERG
jgi:hypothetical protein